MAGLEGPGADGGRRTAAGSGTRPRTPIRCSPSTTSRTRPRPSYPPFERRRSCAWTAWASGPPPRSASAEGNRVEPVAELRFPHSLGLLYSAFTYFMRLQGQLRRVQADGPRPLRRSRGTPTLIRDELIDVKPDGSFRLDMRYFEFLHGLRMTGRRFERTLRRAARDSPSRPSPSARWTWRRRSRRSPRRSWSADSRASACELTGEEPVPGGRGRAELRRQRPHPADEARSTSCGSSPPRATPAARSARRCSVWHSVLGQAASTPGTDAMRGVAASGPATTTDGFQRYLDAQGLPYTG